MFDVILMEFKKLKRTTIVWLSVLGGVAAPLLNFMLYMYRKSNGYDAVFSDMVNQVNMFILLLLGLMLYSLVTAYTYSREYEEDTLKSVLTIPVGRTTLVISKLIVVIIWVFLLTLLSYVTTTILAIIGGFSGIDSASLFAAFKYFIKSFLYMLPLLTPVIFATLLFKKYIPAMVMSIVIATSNLMIMNSKYAEIFPWTIPLILTNPPDVREYPVYLSYVSLTATGIIFLILSVIYFRKRDL